MKFKLLSLILILCLCSCSDNMPKTDWIFVEGGSFLQGERQVIISPKGDTVRGFTSPKREVILNDFYISKYEVTVAEFKEYCKQTNTEMPKPPKMTAYGEDAKSEWKDNHPMLATWNEADAYAKWMDARLPTEAEWEYAAKGGNKSNGYSYSGSDDPQEVGWVKENAEKSFHPVGLLKANELGIHDMTGNVSEWVSDWYNPKLDDASDTNNPKGPSEGIDHMKISKGVSWFYESVDQRTGLPLKQGIHIPEVRYQSPILTRNDGFGFRIAKDK